MLLKRIIEESRIYEGLIITHAAGKSVDIMTTWFSLKKGTYSLEAVSSGLLKFKTEKINNTDLGRLLSLMNNLGWYPSLMLIGFFSTEKVKFDEIKYLELLNDGKNVNVLFEAKYNLELDEKDLPDIMYHLTSKKSIEKITKIGLSPRSKNKIAKHAERVYLLTDESGVDFLLKSNKFYPDEKEFILFEVDVKGLLSRRSMRFFTDPYFKDYAVYTYENIPPQFLSIKKEISR